MPKVASVAEAMRKEVKREKKTGPWIEVRALQRLFYGYPLEDIREPGQVFRMRLSDLKEYEPGPKGAKARYHTGVEVRTIEHDGKKYALPYSVEDAKAPSLLAEPDEDEEEGESTGADVL